MSTTNLFVSIDHELAEALAAVAQLAGTTKRGAVEATICDRLQRPHRDRQAVRQAWANYRNAQTQE